MTFAPRLAKHEGVNLRSPTANSLKQLALQHANSIYFGSHGRLSRVKIRIRGGSKEAPENCSWNGRLAAPVYR